MSTSEPEITPPDTAGAGAQAQPAKFELVRYEAARKALAEACSVDEVRNIHDVARQMAAAARVAKNRDLEANAFELRVRAERRLGEMIAAQKATVGLNVGGRPKTGTIAEPVFKPGTLAEAGID